MNPLRQNRCHRASTVLTLISLFGALTLTNPRPTPAQTNALPGASGTLWVTNRSLNNVGVFDAGTGDLVATIAVGVKPIGVTAPHGTGKVYVSDEGSDTVSVISKESLSVVATIPLTRGSKPHHIGQSPNGKFVYVAEFGTNKVAVIATNTDTLAAEFITGAPAARTHAVWVTRDGKTLYVTNSVTNEIAALDALTGEPLWSLPVGNNPSEILVTPDGKTAYVSVRNESMVKIIDLIERAITGATFIGTQPDTLQLTNNQQTLVVALRGIPAQVAYMDTDSLAVTWADLPGATTGHHWLSANGRYAFVALEGPGRIAVIDGWDLSVAATYAYPGGGSPHGVFYEPQRLIKR